MKYFYIILFLLGCFVLSAQPELSDSVLSQLFNTSGSSQKEELVNVSFGKKIYPAIIENGDTIIIARLANINVSSPKKFENHTEYLKYLRYRKYAATVRIYALEAIRIFKEAEYATQNLKKRKRKKHLKKLSKRLEKKFEAPLKKLTKTQGKILVKMIERELGRSMYDLIKETNGRWKAMYWNQSSKLYGYRLKEGYIYGQRPLLDIVLQDFDISNEETMVKFTE